MLQDEQTIQQSKRDRRNDEHVHRCDGIGMIVKKRLPALRWWPLPSRHIFCNGCLPDIDSELEQFAMDPGCSRERVRDAHLTNVFTGLYRLAPNVLDAVKILKPETIIRWHRTGFRAYWRWKSRPLGGRPATPVAIRQLRLSCRARPRS